MIEINEIEIHIRVGEPGGNASGSSAEDLSPDGVGLNRNEIVEECVRRVLQEIRTKRER